ncbi:patched family protein [Necator americanus]|uniref:Patched family protein n=1 Tax=Necator americanus TaxID=51031 RepID=W2TXI6_NECAM|nr:patched family protein [Necator americanus]ETN86389.1 patched family protein [Necator americanus]
MAASTDFKLNTTNETLQVFLPDKMESISDFKKLVSLFPPRDAQRDTYSVFGSKFASIIVEDLQGNAVAPSAIEKLATLHRSILKLRTSDNISFHKVCLRQSGSCALHPLAYALEDEEPVLSVQFLLRYPMLKLGDLAIDSALVFGGVSVNESRDEAGNAPLDSARAVRIFYMLDATDRAERWIDVFLEHMSEYQQNSLRIFWSSSKSLAKEMERNGTLLIPWMPWTAVLLVLFCMTACSSKNVVRSQPFIGFFAMLNATMATIASMALLFYVRYPFLPLVLIMPFLIVSIGTDNMFLMLKSWRLTQQSDVDRRFVEALTETAASLFLTSLTDGLSFSVGSMSNFYAVRVFCTYCAMAILFMFFFQVTFFNAVMVLCCRRELAGRHSLFCYKLSDPDIVNDVVRVRSSTDVACGGVLAKIVSSAPAKVTIVLVYLLYLAASINYALVLPLGLDLKLLAPFGSYAANELRAQERLFFDYGPYCFAVVYLHNRSLSNPEERRKLLHLYDALSSSKYASKAEFWLEEFEAIHGGRLLTHDTFKSAVSSLFAATPKFRNDIRFDLEGNIEAIKMLLRIRSLGPSHDKPRAEFLRTTMRSSSFDGFVYDTRIERRLPRCAACYNRCAAHSLDMSAAFMGTVKGTETRCGWCVLGGAVEWHHQLGLVLQSEGPAWIATAGSGEQFFFGR